MTPEPDSYTPHRPIRIEDSLWDALGAVVGSRKRAGLVRDLLRWWLRVPGAKLPPRPSRDASDSGHQNKASSSKSTSASN